MAISGNANAGAPRSSALRKLLIGAVAVALAAAILGLAGCGGSSDSGSASASAAAGDAAADKQQVTVAFVTNGYPTSFYDDANEPSGYEVDVVKAVADKLSDKYEYKFEGVDQTAVFAGLASGKYDQGLTNSFWTPERAEKYLQPEEAIGATILGILVRNEDADVRSLRDAAEKGLKLAPITAGDGNYYVVEDYNDKNPDAPLDLQATDDTNAFTEAFDWVAQGRYDLHVIPLQYYNGLVVQEDGAYHKYVDDLKFVIIGGTKTWSFEKPGNEAYAADWSAAIKELEADGTLEELSRKWYDGINNFAFLGDAGETYSFLDEAIPVDPDDESELANR